MNVHHTSRHVIPFIEKYKRLLPGTRVLEIGCGEAGVLKAFLNRGCTGLGVEMDENRLILAKELLADDISNGKVLLLAKDIYKVDLEDQTRHGFDQIVLKDVIEHIHDPEKLIRRLKLFLKPGGVIFFGFPPWQMPYGGHQQLLRSKLSKLPYIHLLPDCLYKRLLRIFKEDEPAFIDIKKTSLSIERFEKIIKDAGYVVVNRAHYLLNPIYELKFGWKARKQFRFITRGSVK